MSARGGNGLHKGSRSPVRKNDAGSNPVGRTMKYKDEDIVEAVKKSTSVAGVMRLLGIRYISGSMQAHINKRIKRLNLDTSHFLGQGWSKGTDPTNKRTFEEVFVYNAHNGAREKSYVLRRFLLEYGREYRCNCCGIDSWNEQPLTLQVDHIDGDPLNNVVDNLRFICPNCHSQTKGWSRRKTEVAGCVG